MKRSLCKPGICAICGGGTSPIDYEEDGDFDIEVEECRSCDAINFYHYRRSVLKQWNNEHDTWPVPSAIGIEFVELIRAPGKLPYHITRGRMLSWGELIDEEESDA